MDLQESLVIVVCPDHQASRVNKDLPERTDAMASLVQLVFADPLDKLEIPDVLEKMVRTVLMESPAHQEFQE